MNSRLTSTFHHVIFHDLFLKCKDIILRGLSSGALAPTDNELEGLGLGDPGAYIKPENIGPDSNFLILGPRP